MGRVDSVYNTNISIIQPKKLAATMNELREIFAPLGFSLEDIRDWEDAGLLTLAPAQSEDKKKKKYLIPNIAWMLATQYSDVEINTVAENMVEDVIRERKLEPSILSDMVSDIDKKLKRKMN